MSSELKVEFRAENGALLTRLAVFGDDGITALHENGRYEYELDSSRFSFQEVSGVISHSRIHHDHERGSIEPGNYVGLLKLVLLDRKSAEPVSETHVEVRSTKLGYDDEYRAMLEDIADRCADFLLQVESPVVGAS